MVYLWKLFFFLKIGNRCHLIFATDAQLLALSGAKNWYVDGTFKLCKALFTQLLTVNAFVQSEDHAKQVPLVFTLMSGKKKKDYRAVIREIIKNIPGQPSVKKVTVDFERAIWSAFQTVLPKVCIMGCAFHWTQALWRKVSVRKVLSFKTNLSTETVSCRLKYAIAFILILFFIISHICIVVYSRSKN